MARIIRISDRGRIMTDGRQGRVLAVLAVVLLVGEPLLEIALLANGAG